MRHHLGRVEQQLKQTQVVRQSGNAGLGHCLPDARNSLPAIGGMHHQLGQHRVVVRRDDRAAVNPGLDAREVIRKKDVVKAAGGGHEVLPRVLGVHPYLDRVAVAGHVGLGQGQRQPRRCLDLQRHQVQLRDALRHRMLDLQPRVDLQEVEILATDQKLHRAKRPVAHLPAQRQRSVQQPLAQACRQGQRRGFLHHFLEAALQGTFAFPQVDDLALPVAQNLHLDMATLGQVALDQQAGVAKRALAFSHRPCDVVVQAVQPVHDAHALAAAASRRLEHYRQADRGHHRRHLGGVIAGPCRAGYQRQADGRGKRLGRRLVTELAQRPGRRPDEGDALVAQCLREIGVLRQKAIAGMHSVGPKPHRRPHHAGDIKVAVTRCRPADEHRFANVTHVQGASVGLRVHGRHRNTQAAAGASNAPGDFAPVGDKDFFEHHSPVLHMRNTPKVVCGLGVRDAASSSRVRAVRVSSGSITPSTHRLAA